MSFSTEIFDDAFKMPNNGWMAMMRHWGGCSQKLKPVNLRTSCPSDNIVLANFSESIIKYKYDKQRMNG